MKVERLNEGPFVYTGADATRIMVLRAHRSHKRANAITTVKTLSRARRSGTLPVDESGTASAPAGKRAA
ncbi:MAG: hypothetical protein JWN65_2723 [Solirubrobacterales bacterium]|nr:hypothetical protein [Solirubrobacterales bacterium]